MELYFDNKWEETKYRSLQRLIKANGGNFQSQKQANYIKTWKNENITAWQFDYWNAPEYTPVEEEYVITVNAELVYRYEGCIRKSIPYTVVYVMDEYGVKRSLHLKYKTSYKVEGWKITGMKLLFERTEITFTPEKNNDFDQPVKKEAEEKPVSNWVGAIGERIEITATVVYQKMIRTTYGSANLYLFKDEKGNVFKAFYSGKAEMEKGKKYKFKATIKEHEEYNGEKQTVISRLTEIKPL